MAWLSPFLLGRPGYEFSFEVPPAAMAIDDGPIAVLQRNLNGALKKSVLRTSAPIIRVDSSYLSITQRNQFASLAGVADTFLSFQTRDDWKMIAEYNIPQDTTHVVIQDNSATKLSALLVAAGFSGVITINSVSAVPSVAAGSGYGQGGFGGGGYAGPDYFSGGSYADATRTVTLGTALPSASSPVYVTYTYKGWAVNLDNFSHSVQGGWVDRFKYSYQLTGA